MKSLLFAFLFATSAPFSGFERAQIKVDQLGDIEPLRVLSVSCDQRGLRHDTSLSVSNTGTQRVLAAVIQLEYIGPDGAVSSTEIVTGAWNEARHRSDLKVPEWASSFGGHSQEWTLWAEELAPGRSVWIAGHPYEILHDAPARANANVLAYLTEDGGWHRQSSVSLRQRAVPDRLDVTRSEYNRLLRCCAGADTLIDGRVEDAGSFTIRRVRFASGEGAQATVSAIIANWSFRPQLVNGINRSEDLTLVLRVGRLSDLRPSRSLATDAASVMPVLVGP